MEHVWESFVELNHTRPVGLVPTAISYTEIEAFNRSTLACLSAADVRLIRRIDEQHLAVKTGSKPKPTNIAGVKSMLRGLAAAKKAKAARGDTRSTS